MAKADGRIIIDTEIQTDGMKPGTKEVEAAVRRMAFSVDDLGKKSQIALQKQAAAFSKLNSQYAAQEEKVKSLAEKIQKYGETKIPTQEYLDIQKQIRETEKKLNTLIQRQEHFLDTGGNKKSNTYTKMQYDIDQLTNTIKYAKGELKDLEKTGGAFILGKDTEKFSEMSNKYSAEAQRLKSMNDSLGASYSRVKNEADEYRKRVLGIDSSHKKADKSGKKFNKTLRNTQKSSKGARMSLARMLATSILFSTVFRAISAVMNGLKEGMNNLAQYSDETNQAFSLLMSRMTQLKNAFATAFSPIIEYAAPALAKLISLLAEAVTWTSELLAALTGKDTFVKAVQVQQDYAESLNKTANSTKDAAEETEKSIAPFDDLIQVQKTSTKEDKKSGNDDLLPFQMFETEEVSSEMKSLADSFGNIIDGIKEKALELKNTFMSGFWDGLGDYKPRLEELKSDLSKIGGYLRDVFTDADVSAAAGRFVNSFVSTIGKFMGALASIGLTIATNIVGGIEIYLSNNVERIKGWLVRMFDIGTEINTILGDFFVAFADVYSIWASQTAQDITGSIIQIFADIFGGVLELTGKFVRDILDIMLTPFTENKEKIKTAALQTLEPIKIVMQSIADTVRKTVDKIVRLYDEHIHPFFMSIRDGLSELLGKLLDAYNEHIVPILNKLADKFKEVMEGPVGDAFDSAIQFIGKLMDALKLLWEDVIVPFIGWVIDNVIPAVAPVIEDLGELLLDLFGKAAEFVDGVFDVLSGLIDFIVGAFKGDWDAAWKGLGDAFKGLQDIADAVFGGIIKIVEKVVGWIEKAVDALADLFKKGGDTSSIGGGYSGGSRPFSAYSTYAAIPYQMPRLATGTVVPPRAGEFAAILGDNKRETEVVSPLSTIKQALKEAMIESGLAGGSRDVHIDMYVDRQRFASAVYKMNNEEKQRVGIRMVTQNG